MLKRILALVAVLVVVFVCAAPCLADGHNGLSGRSYSCFPIDTVILNNGSSAGNFFEWPCNQVTDRVSVNNPYGGYFYYGLDGYAISGEMGLNATSFTLHSRLTYVDPNSYFLFTPADDYGDVVFTRVRLEFDYILIDSRPDRNTHRAELVHVTYDSSVHGLKDRYSVNVIEYITDAYTMQSGTSNIGLRVIIHDFDFTVDYYFSGDDVYPYIGFELGTSSDPNSFLFSWLNGLRLSKPVSADSAFPLSWLVNSVSAFLELEIFPGMTVNLLFSLAIMAGLIMFLIRLIS